ncbi:uncharacterized protein LOC120271668 [Dioscorea cayenensis subsp. rotundata]|uniref:Uncharacterized protein LOC120271668 n=1 Tax=Dioscorea cayennensis subsp. rotundata TaxID=55577 RepID=A0AB40C542_DIOCR|nr:uncharacterized protein LOC120271668 [Dioscorea cayenensis subsp. rotundata]
MRKNFSVWSIKMQAVMEANDMWDVVDPADPEAPVGAKQNKVARATIFSAIPEDAFFLIVKKESAREARIQSLKEELDTLKMKSSENIEDYALKVGTIVNKIRELGEKIEDPCVVRRMLRSLPNKFLQIVSSIKKFAYLKTMSVEELIGRLKWIATKEKKDGERSSNGLYKGGGGARGHGRGCGCGRGCDRGDGERAHNNKKFDKTKIKCFNCHNFGHYESEYRLRKREEKAHIAEKKDDEPAFLMAKVCQVACADKRRVEKDKFTDLDDTIARTVKFGDGSIVEICVLGSVLFKCNSGEHKCWTNAEASQDCFVTNEQATNQRTLRYFHRTPVISHSIDIQNLQQTGIRTIRVMATSNSPAPEGTLGCLSQSSVPVFTGQEYKRWNLQMKTIFRSQELWDLVENGVTESKDEALERDNRKRDAKALCLI